MNKSPRLIYIANARIPSEKAHGMTIVKSCEALALAGAAVELVVPKRKNAGLPKDTFSFYGAKRNFKITFLPTLDLFAFEKHIGKLAFWIEIGVFYFFVYARFLFSPRQMIIYSRDTPALLLKLRGFRVFFECHHLPRRSGLYFLLNRLANGVIVISRQLKIAYQKAGFAEDRILVAPSGVDLDIFDLNISKEEAREKLNLPQELKIVTYTGNFRTFGADKGIGDIIESLRYLPPDIIFTAVGGSDRDIDFYRHRSETAGVSNRVFLFGRTDQKTLALYQKAADTLLMPFPDSKHYREHMSPVKMFEYMGSGRPIIGSDLLTIREVLDESNALLVPPGDPPALAAAIEKLLADPEMGQRLAAAALKSVGQYSWGKRSKKVLDFIGASC